MTLLETIDLKTWNGPTTIPLRRQAIQKLEGGKILYLPQLDFQISEEEKIFFNCDKVDPQRKNISYDPKKDLLAGTLWTGSEHVALKKMLQRYCVSATQLIETLLPHYISHYTLSKTSFRPVEIFGRKSSPLKDDTRLHVDAFPSNPTNGARILRVFTNINPNGKARVWKVGEPFENVVQKFAHRAPRPLPFSSHLLKFLKITKKLRSPYDHYMLQIHNKMKEDISYQDSVEQEEIHFLPGSSWIVYTDQVSHAALSGQHVLEQTFFIPTNKIGNPSTAPLRVLEHFFQRPLISD